MGKITFAYLRVTGVSYNKHIAYALGIRAMEQSLSKFNLLKSETSIVVSECEITETKIMPDANLLQVVPKTLL